MKEVNNGINMSGGTINAGAISVGSKASASNVTVPDEQELAELREQTRALISAIRAEAEQLPAGNRALTEAEEVRDELALDAPRKPEVLRRLRGIAEAVGAVGGLAEVVFTLEHLAMAVL